MVSARQYVRQFMRRLLFLHFQVLAIKIEYFIENVHDFSEFSEKVIFRDLSNNLIFNIFKYFRTPTSFTYKLYRFYLIFIIFSRLLRKVVGHLNSNNNSL